MLLDELALVDATLVDDEALAGAVVMLEVLALEVELELDEELDDWLVEAASKVVGAAATVVECEILVGDETSGPSS
jgi:hypothetical protein